MLLIIELTFIRVLFACKLQPWNTEARALSELERCYFSGIFWVLGASTCHTECTQLLLSIRVSEKGTVEEGVHFQA